MNKSPWASTARKRGWSSAELVAGPGVGVPVFPFPATTESLPAGTGEGVLAEVPVGATSPNTLHAAAMGKTLRNLVIASLVPFSRALAAEVASWPGS